MATQTINFRTPITVTNHLQSPSLELEITVKWDDMIKPNINNQAPFPNKIASQKLEDKEDLLITMA